MKVEITDRQTDVKVDHARLKEIVEQTLKDAGCTQSISIALVTPEEIKQLNTTYKKREAVTDVLAFPMGDDLLGDVAICPAMAAEEAGARCRDVMDEPGARSRRVEDEVLLYAVHGALHLLGYDDTEERADEMYAKEDEILWHFGVEVD